MTDYCDINPRSRPQIIVIGTDVGLAYLLGRYAEQSGCGMTMMQPTPPVTEVCRLELAAIVFLSFEDLGAAQLLIAELGNCDVPVLVCSSVADDARARELGADYCLLHPLTYDHFLAALAATRVP